MALAHISRHSFGRSDPLTEGAGAALRNRIALAFVGVARASRPSRVRVTSNLTKRQKRKRRKVKIMTVDA